MRIELNTGGLSSGAVISGFQTDFSSLQSKSQSMISALQAVKSFVHSMNGGVGTLQGAVDQISSRQSSEDAKSSKLNEVASKANGFVELARRIDLEVGGMVDQNKNEFYDVNPWSRPPEPEREKKWYEKGWDWVCDKGKKLGKGIKKAVTWTVDSLGKIKDCIVDFCKEHWKEIVKITIAVVIIAALAVATVATGGAAGGVAGFILAGALKGAIIGGITSAAIGGGISAINHRISTGSWDGAGNAVFTGVANGMLSGVIIGGVAGGAGNAIKVIQAGKMWNPGTFKSGYDSMKYHYGKHAIKEGFSKGNNIVKYTKDALDFSNRNSSLLKYTFNGKHGNAVWRLVFDNTRYVPGQGGSFDSLGRIIQFWYKSL